MSDSNSQVKFIELSLPSTVRLHRGYYRKAVFHHREDTGSLRQMDILINTKPLTLLKL